MRSQIVTAHGPRGGYLHPFHFEREAVDVLHNHLDNGRRPAVTAFELLDARGQSLLEAMTWRKRTEH